MLFHLKYFLSFLFCSSLTPASTSADKIFAPIPTTAQVTSARFTPSGSDLNSSFEQRVSSPVTAALVVASISSTTNNVPKSDYRCGVDEQDSRTTCGKLCIYNSDCDDDEHCWSTFPNECYVNELSADPPALAPVRNDPITTRPVATTPGSPVSTSMTPVASPPSLLIPLKTDFRCGVDEEDSRTNCGRLCTFSSDCYSGEYCWSTFPNECYVNDIQNSSPTATLSPINSDPITSAPSTATPITFAPSTATPITSAPSTATPITSAPATLVQTALPPVKITFAPVIFFVPTAVTDPISVTSTDPTFLPMYQTSTPTDSTTAPVDTTTAPTEEIPPPLDPITASLDATPDLASAAPVTLPSATNVAFILFQWILIKSLLPLFL